MPRSPARAVIVSTLSAAALLTASGCLAALPEQAPRDERALASPTGQTSSGPAAAPDLSEAQAQAALISETDLGEPWTPTEGAATWRDGMLKASTGSADCQRLLDDLYAEELFGADARTLAVVGLDDTADQAQLRYQIVSHRPAEVDRALAWLRTLPQKCGEFMSTTAHGAAQAVQVQDTGMPEIGDARQGLRVVLSIPSDYDEPLTLTLDIAAVRVGADAIAVTNGGLGEVPTDATRAAVELGIRRLTDIRKQGRVEV